MIECLHDNLVGVLLQEARSLRGDESLSEFVVDLKKDVRRPPELKMAFYGSHIGTAKIVADSSGLSYQDCFMKQAIFVKSKETTNLSVSP